MLPAGLLPLLDGLAVEDVVVIAGGATFAVAAKPIFRRQPDSISAAPSGRASRSLLLAYLGRW